MALILYLRTRKNPITVIRNTLKRAGYSDRVVNNWIAISAHETAGWTSRVYRDANNLFGMTLAGKNTTAVGALPYGEHQAIYNNIQSSADDLVLYLQKRFKYPADFATLRDQVEYMKSKNYFGDSFANYYAGALRWKNELDLTGKNQEV